MTSADGGLYISHPLRARLAAPTDEVEYLSEEWYRREFPGFPDDRIYTLLSQISLGNEQKETCPRLKSKKGGNQPRDPGDELRCRHP